MLSGASSAREQKPTSFRINRIVDIRTRPISSIPRNSQLMTTTAAAVPVPMSAAEEAAYKRRWIALILLSLSLMLIVIDSTIVNIAFPAIQSTFKASYADAEWVNSIYSLVFGAALIT